MIPEVITQIFYPTVELAIPTGIPANEVNAETETQPVTQQVFSII